MPWSAALPQAMFAHPLVSVVTPITTGSLVGYHTNRELPLPMSTTQFHLFVCKILTKTRQRSHQTSLPFSQKTPFLPPNLGLPGRLDCPLRHDGLRNPPRNSIRNHSHRIPNFLIIIYCPRLGRQVSDPIHFPAGVESPLDAAVLHVPEAGVGVGGSASSERECGGVDAYLVEA